MKQGTSCLLEHEDKKRVESPAYTHCRPKSLLQAHIQLSILWLKHVLNKAHCGLVLFSALLVTDVPGNKNDSVSVCISAMT